MGPPTRGCAWNRFRTRMATGSKGCAGNGQEAGRCIMGVFVLGTGNHQAGWRYEGAATSHMQLPVIQEIARIAERGKFDLLFISNSMVMDPTDHPRSSAGSSRRPHHGAQRLHDAYRARRDGFDELLRAVQRRADLRLDRPYEQRARGMERGHHVEHQSGAQLQPRRASRARAALCARPGIRRCRQGPVGLLGRRRDRRRQGDRAICRRRQGSRR